MSAIVSESKRQFTEYGLRVKGVWGRNRTVKYQSFTLLESETKRPVEEVRPLVEAKLAEIKAKPGLVYIVYEGAREESVTRYEDGNSFRTVCYSPLDDVKLYGETVGGVRRAA